MHSMRSPALLALCLGSAGLTAVVAPAYAATPAARTAAAACPVSQPTFATPTYVDTGRAGGEPQVETAAGGRLLYSSHAGTTHIFAPAGASPTTAAFPQNYTGQTYIWTSDDQGKSWQFRDRRDPTQGGAPLTGFSDPEFAVDSAGGIFFSEINLANVATYASKDNGTTYQLKKLNGLTLTDRQWMEADRPNEYYIAANSFGGDTSPVSTSPLSHYLAKTTDGGASFTPSVVDEKGGSGLGDNKVDKRNGTFYEPHYAGDRSTPQPLYVAAFRSAREGVLTDPDLGLIAPDVALLAHWPSIDVASDGSIYATWDESGEGPRPAGIYFSSSGDGGRTWLAPKRLDSDGRTDIWPWLAVGDSGRVAVAWLEADVALPKEDAETPGTHGWRVMMVETTSGLGCAGGAPVFSAPTAATPDPVHTGTICQGGTACQAQAIDRRMGDYFSVGVDATGAAFVGVSDTRKGGAVSLPLFVRQSGGTSLLSPPPAGPTYSVPTAAAGTGQGTSSRQGTVSSKARQPSARGATSSRGPAKAVQPTRTLAFTGPLPLLAPAGLLLLAAALWLRRRRATR